MSDQDPLPVDPMLAWQKARSIGADTPAPSQLTSMGMPMPSPTAMAWLGLGKAATPQNLKDLTWSLLKNVATSKAAGQAATYSLPDHVVQALKRLMQGRQ